jgi:hypothetical protein
LFNQKLNKPYKILENQSEKHFEQTSRLWSAVSLAKQENVSNNNNNNNKRGPNSPNWNDLNEKIENWFDEHDVADQKIVYRFLKDLKYDDIEQRPPSSVLSGASSTISEQAQNLEDILNNLKRYKRRFNKKSNQRSKTELGPVKSASSYELCYPQASKQQQLQSKCKCLTVKENDLYMSSSFRTMRHLKSSDIRNKYPLPKANPDFHFRNATVFMTCGRPPKSTYLLHPDWV